jgi:hypothetical protein
MTDFGQFLFFAIGIGGGLVFLAWVTIDNLKREFRDDESLSSPPPSHRVTPTTKENNNG